MADVKDKACPFRVRRVLRQTTLGGSGSEYVDEFLPCDGEDCAAYYQGACLRLIPPALVIDDGISDDDQSQDSAWQATSVPSHWEYDGGVEECPF